MNEINEAIEKKEQELKILSQHRIDQLELLLKDRDDLLVDTLRKFDLLKNDFDYNLALIDARDVEIKRLEKIIKEERSKSALLESLNAKLQSEVISERDSCNKMREISNQEKIENQVIRFYVAVHS